jgi:hypothetical protein
VPGGHAGHGTFPYRQLTSFYSCLSAQTIRTIAYLEDRQQLPDIARGLFEQFWWYDQVVFDVLEQNKGNPIRPKAG